CHTYSCYSCHLFIFIILLLIILLPPISTLFPYTTLFRSVSPEPAHILFVEDAVDLAQVVMRELEAEGYRVTHVTDGEAALQAERSEEHTSELQSRENLVCRLLLEKKNIK